jgi:hypothetical protein
MYQLTIFDGLAQLGTVMANTLENLLHELHKTVVIDGLRQLDNAEMTLAFFCLPAR